MKSRAALVYAILQDMKIDVGLIIQHSIFHGFEKGIQGFPHPHLITNLRANVGVKWNAKEEVRKLKGVINDSVVVKIQGEDSEMAPRHIGAGSNSQARPGTIQTRLEHIDRDGSRIFVQWRQKKFRNSKSKKNRLNLIQHMKK